MVRVGIFYSQGNLLEAGNILESLASEDMDDFKSSTLNNSEIYMEESKEAKYLMDMYSTIEKALVSLMFYYYLLKF